GGGLHAVGKPRPCFACAGCKPDRVLRRSMDRAVALRPPPTTRVAQRGRRGVFPGAPGDRRCFFILAWLQLLAGSRGGILVFNFFTTREGGKEPLFEVIQGIGDLAKLRPDE